MTASPDGQSGRPSAAARADAAPPTGTPPTLEIRNVVKSFGGRVVLDVDELAVLPGQIHALLGQNGSGKSTLVKVLSGYHSADRAAGATVRVAGTAVPTGSPAAARAAGMRFVHQDLGLVANMAIVDNLHMGQAYPTRGLTVRSRAAREGARASLARVGLAGLDPDATLALLSPAERTGVAIARALAGDDPPAVLVLDEPTATLPAAETDRLLATLAGVAHSGVAVLYVTHHLDEVFRIAAATTILRDGRKIVSAPTAELTRDDIVGHLAGDEPGRPRRPASQASPQPQGRGQARLEVRDIVADRVDGVSFTVTAGEIVGFHGVTGSGRDALLGAVFGADARSGGTVRVGKDELPPGRPDLAIRLGIGYVPADRKARGCLLALSATENLTLPGLKPFWRAGRLRATEEAQEASRWFTRLGVRPADGQALPMASFSGGNQQKVVLAKWLRQGPRALLLDEPTQGVDVAAKATIHRTILDAAAGGLGVVLATSDDEEMAALCTTVHVIRQGRIVDTLVGTEITEAGLRRRLNTPALPAARPRSGATA